MEPRIERLTCVILAAGCSVRMGRPKASLVVRGRTLLERAFDAARGQPTVVVVGAVADDVRAVLDQRVRGGNVRIVVNDSPALGMARSFALADALIVDRAHALAVLLLDTPFVDAALRARVAAARGDADVAFPVRNDVPGHPVVFGPRARPLIGSVTPGDTLRYLRDDPRLTRVRIPVNSNAPFVDVDTPSDFAQLE